jgi:hypothetical protein
MGFQDPLATATALFRPKMQVLSGSVNNPHTSVLNDYLCLEIDSINRFHPLIF